MPTGMESTIKVRVGGFLLTGVVFGCELSFGTGGLRGILGAGTNRMNVHIVRRAAQAVAEYLNGTGLHNRAAIGFDSRLGSARFARETAAVFAANGIEVCLYPRLEPVPALSFAVRALSCGVGVCITASHNPAQYNGFKVYGSDGCQLTPAGVAQIAADLRNRSYFGNICSGDFDALLASGSIHWIPDKLLDAYIDSILSLRVTKDGLSGLKLVYTPLNGSGKECVEKLFKNDLTLVSEQAETDGNFPTCPYPNPEIREAMQKGLKLSRIVKPDLLIGTDPNYDRCGVAVPDKGSYRLLSGTHVRDKDGVNAASLLCKAASWYQKRGMTLASAIDALYECFGCYVHLQLSLAFSGADAMAQIASVMQRLRENPPASIGSLSVSAITDYLTGPTGLPRSDVLAFRLTGGASVVVRPSGTEPKLKLYLSANADTRAAAVAQLRALETACRTLLQFGAVSPDPPFSIDASVCIHESRNKHARAKRPVCRIFRHIIQSDHFRQKSLVVLWYKKNVSASYRDSGTAQKKGALPCRKHSANCRRSTAV